MWAFLRRNFLRLTLAALFCGLLVPVLGGCASAPPPPPPPRRVEVKPAKPGPNFVWVEGHWKWKGRRRGHVWVPGHWRRR